MRSSSLSKSDPQNPNSLPKQYRYHGLSMCPTFKPGQVLYVRPEAEGVQPGDVVVYRQGDETIVHRVKSVQGTGIHTRGDNNPREDETPIPADQIIGVVEKVDDWGTFHPVASGRKGLWFARLRWGMRGMFHKMLPWLGAPYRWLKASRWVPRLWRPYITTVQLQTQNGILIKYVVHGKTVATWQPQQSRFTCRRPYDLIIFPPEVATIEKSSIAALD
jgi:hypothetical protein